MGRFLKDSDYFLIKNEILKLLDGSTAALGSSIKLLRAEETAIAQIKNRLAGRFDVAKIFAQNIGDPDTRDAFIVMITIDITLYHLYAQTGSKDVPEHRAARYQDVMDWLKDASNGSTPTNLPSALTDDNQGEFRIWSASKPENHDY